MSPRRSAPARVVLQPADAPRARILLPLLVALAVSLTGCTAPDESGNGAPTPTPTSPANPTPTTGGPPQQDGGPADEEDDAIPRRGETTVFDNDFEAASLAPWTANADVGAAGDAATWKVELNDERPHNGSRSVRVALDGTQDAGTVWMVREVNLTAGDGYAVNLSAWVWSPNRSLDRLADLVLYVGTSPPTDEESFAPENGGGRHAANREPLDLEEGWRQYYLDWATPVPENGTLYVAVGVSVVWESGVEYFVDDVRAEFTKLE